MRSKIIVIIALSVIVVIFSSVLMENPRLIDRGLYRLGFQEQVCVTETYDSDLKNVTNIAIAGDFGINENSVKTLKNIKSYEPEIVLMPGDLGQASAEEWFNISNIMDGQNMYVTFGDADITERDKFQRHYGMEKGYFSFDYNNIHVLGISTNDKKNEFGVISNDKEQIDFILTDLINSKENDEIDFTIVFMHLPMYSSRIDGSFMDLRNELQPIFDSYGVDLVISGHTHIYERTQSLTFDEIITNENDCYYDNTEGQIYLTVGTGGHSHVFFNQKHPWSIVQNHNDYGFLNLSIVEGEDIIIGKFVTNSGKIFDTFMIRINDS
jgi:predicted phosphodiesterase|tara:strand:- start:388 stop:1359 length:972 start_codon:yes stop_codon:yes gene_type:complete